MPYWKGEKEEEEERDGKDSMAIEKLRHSELGRKVGRTGRTGSLGPEEEAEEETDEPSCGRGDCRRVDCVDLMPRDGVELDLEQTRGSPRARVHGTGENRPRLSAGRSRHTGD